MNDRSAARPDPGPVLPPPASELPRTTLDWPRHTGTTGAVLEELQVQLRFRRRRRRQLRGAVGAAAVLLITGWLWQAPPPSAALAPGPVVSATASVPQRQVLPDGSVVLLRTGAELSVDFSAALRRVRLIRGEALFEVAKNAQRPFIVSAGGVDVRAVGTAFAVTLQQSAVEVLVTEGQVAVQETDNQGQRLEDSSEDAAATIKKIDAPAPDPSMSAIRPVASEWMLDAGKRIVVGFEVSAVTPEVVPLSPAEIDERLSWRVPRLQFARTPLHDAIAMINQYSRSQLSLEGTVLKDVPLSGAIRADNIDALLELLELEYGIEAEHRGQAEIVLRKSR